MSKCLYQCCKEPATHGGRCATHHRAFREKQSASRLQPKCQRCRDCLPLSYRSVYCYRCIEAMEEQAIMQSRMDFLDGLMRGGR